jgi:hypothetical protein
MGTFSEEHGGERVPGQRPRPLPHTNLMNKARNPKSGTHPSIVRGEHGTSTLVSSGGIPRDWSSRAGTVPRALHRRLHPPSPRGRRRHSRRRPPRSSPEDTSSSLAASRPGFHPRRGGRGAGHTRPVAAGERRGDARFKRGRRSRCGEQGGVSKEAEADGKKRDAEFAFASQRRDREWRTGPIRQPQAPFPVSRVLRRMRRLLKWK